MHPLQKFLFECIYPKWVRFWVGSWMVLKELPCCDPRQQPEFTQTLFNCNDDMTVGEAGDHPKEAWEITA
jgi:hypothetical protein